LEKREGSFLLTGGPAYPPNRPRGGKETKRRGDVWYIVTGERGKRGGGKEKERKNNNGGNDPSLLYSGKPPHEKHSAGEKKGGEEGWCFKASSSTHWTKEKDYWTKLLRPASRRGEKIYRLFIAT